MQLRGLPESSKSRDYSGQAQHIHDCAQKTQEQHAAEPGSYHAAIVHVDPLFHWLI
jgi:hypothetical protein